MCIWYLYGSLSIIALAAVAVGMKCPFDIKIALFIVVKIVEFFFLRVFKIFRQLWCDILL